MAEGLALRKNLNFLKEEAKKHPDKPEAPALDSIKTYAKTTITRWKLKGVNNYAEFLEYINGPALTKADERRLDLWREEKSRYKAMWEYVGKCDDLHRKGLKECTKCSEVKKFEYFPTFKGVLKGGLCRKCIKEKRERKEAGVLNET